MTRSTVISATHATDGDTVYLTSCDAWTPDVAVAELLGAQDVDWRLEFANRLREVSNPRPLPASADQNGLAQLATA